MNFTLIQDVLRSEEVVVTGTMTPKKKLESSVAITTLTPQDIARAMPRSTTEMLRYVPGFTRVESSGGEVNQNISVRGILGVEYVMFMEDGLPVFPTMHTFFMNADNLFRADENIERMEVVRGGTSALFGSNTPGAIINFINKTGGATISGSIKATGGTEELARYDFNVNGPLAEEWRFNLGGFYRFDRGVRNPGFPGTRGGQLKSSATRVLSNGFVRISTKIIDDRNQFILPLPFKNPGDPEYVPGFSDYGSMNTAEGNQIAVPTPIGSLELPLEDGLRTKALWLTADVGVTVGDQWYLQNTAQWMQNEQGWNAILPFDVLPANDYVKSHLEGYFGSYYAPFLQAQNRLPAGTLRDLSITALPGFQYQARYTNVYDAFGNKQIFNTPNGYLAPGGEWHVEKPISAFQNQLQIKKQFGNHKLSLGAYVANYTQTNRWYFTDILTDVRDNPHFVDLMVNSADLRYNFKSPFTNQDTSVTIRVNNLQATKNGFRRFLSLYRNGSGTTTIFSAVVGDEIQLTDRFRVEIGLRYETDQFVQSAENSSTTDLDGNPLTQYDSEPWGNTSFRHFRRTLSDWAGSVGMNYTLDEATSVYALASRAFKMPALDEFLDASAQAQVDKFEDRQTLMLEMGVKHASPTLGLMVNGFYGELKNIVGQGAETNPLTGETIWKIRRSPDNRVYGVEVELSAAPLAGLNLIGAGTLLKPQTLEASGSALTAGGIPDAILNLSGSYKLSDFTFLADWHYVGARDLINADYDPDAGKYKVYQKIGTLPTYHYANLSAVYSIPGQGLSITASLLNAYQSVGLEEGNPRLPSAGGRELFLARPILPRRLTVSLGYQF